MKLTPKYSMWEAIDVAITVGMRALDEIRMLARTPGPAGAPGRDGRDGVDGVGFDDMKFQYDGERTFTFQFVKGERVVEEKHTVPVMIYRGVYRDGQEYKQGDTCSYGGHIWHCDTDTKDKPDGVERCWTMAMRKARDGKDGVVKELKPSVPVKVA